MSDKQGPNDGDENKDINDILRKKIAELGMTDEFNACSFCGRGFDDDVPMVRSILNESVKMCFSCVDEAMDVIEETPLPIPSSRDIKTYLDQYVVGQEAPKKTFSVAVHKHYKRIKYNEENPDDPVEKSNILLLGPSGSGKTLLAKTVSREMGVPYASADATQLTEAGYKGLDVESVLEDLIESARGDLTQAQKGIVYIDEIDKIQAKSEASGRDVSGKGVQQALLKLVEGKTFNLGAESAQPIPFDTSNILVIVSGAFTGLTGIVKERLAKERKGSGSEIGFGSEPGAAKKISDDEALQAVTPADLEKFGMLKEFLGRFPVITATHEMDEKMLLRVLTEPKNALVKQFQKLSETDGGPALHFEKEALQAIAMAAIKMKTGSRGLRGIMEKVTEDITFNNEDQGDNVTITADMVEAALSKKPNLPARSKTSSPNPPNMTP